MSLIDHYKVITVTHQNLDISDIGNFYVNTAGRSQEDSLEALRIGFAIDELMYLETCNRVSFILFTESIIDTDYLYSFFKKVNPELEEATLDHINSFVDVYEGESAIKHVFEMASSMDSLVVGEREIFRQFRTAYNHCHKLGLTGDNLRILEKATVATAKKVYSETRIAEKALSVVSLAIQALMNIHDNRQQRILLVGSGETNTLVAKFLRKYQFANVSIYNRSIDNARKLADMLGAESFHLNELSLIEGGFDTIIICTSANRVVIDESLYRKMLKGDDSEKMIIDLAVPRNISEKLVENFNVNYIDISRLKEISEKNLEQRRQELRRARPIIFKQLISFKTLFHNRQLERALSNIPDEIKAIKNRALTAVYGNRLEALDDESRRLVNEMMDYMEKKCISVPLKAARTAKM